MPTIAPYLTKLFNASLSQGVFSEDWKKSRITVLKKISIPSSPSDFHLIAILCFLSKVLENLAHDKITNFLTKSKMLDMFRKGFRKHYSTQSALTFSLRGFFLHGEKKKNSALPKMMYQLSCSNAVTAYSIGTAVPSTELAYVFTGESALPGREV